MPDDPQKKQQNNNTSKKDDAAKKDNNAKKNDDSTNSNSTKKDSIPQITITEFQGYIHTGVRKDKVNVAGIGIVCPVDEIILLKPSENNSPTEEETDWFNNFISSMTYSDGFSLASIPPSLRSYLKSNDWFWRDAKGGYRSTKLLEPKETGKLVRGATGYGYSAEYAAKAAKPWNIFGNAVSGIALGFTMWDIKKNGQSGGNTLDFFFGLVSFIPGIGWAISGIYAVTDKVVETTTGKKTGDHASDYLNQKKSELDRYLLNKFMSFFSWGF